MEIPEICCAMGAADDAMPTTAIRRLAPANYGVWWLVKGGIRC